MKKIISACIVALFFFFSISFLPLFSGKGKLVEIPEGCSGYAAAEIISSQLSPRCRKLCSVSLLMASSMYGSAKPGVYRLGMTSAFSAMKTLCRGERLKITVREGMTVPQVTSLIRRTLKLSVNDPVMTAIEKNSATYEGMLFPAVYQIFKTNPSPLISEMTGLFKTNAQKYNITEYDLVLASIVQKETRYYFEMKRCAGVLANRLHKNMMLECDTILMYEVGNQRISKELIAKDSPYNSFIRKGLPPSPICSPGLDALKAAKDPEKNDFLYFVAKKDGHLYFSKNKHEHFKAVEFYVLGRPNGFHPRTE